jgi:hypothetical protein
LSNELVQQNGAALAAAPFGKMMAAGSSLNAGAVAIESERAIAEARGQMQLAKMFPRDNNAAFAELMDACKLPALAGVAFYSRPQGGKTVTGPSIRLAEEIARCYGNFEYGHRELSRGDGKSEVEVYAWDKEKNNRSIRQITVQHTIDTKDGPRKLRDQREVDDRIANVASKQVRGRILALMPKWMVESAIEECKKTLAGDNSVPLAERVRKMTQAFAQFGVTTEHLEKYLGHPLDKTLADELVDLTGVFNALRDGGKPSEFFGATEEQSESASAAAAITQQAKAAAGSAKAASAKKAEAEPAAQQDSKPEKKDGKAAQESKRESSHKDDTAKPSVDDAPPGNAKADGAPDPESNQEGDVF